ncbi:MAG: nuclear transport factor 2 family protein [Actinomycetota bacterium]
MTTAAVTHPLVAAIADALDRGDRAALAALYAADATYSTVGGAHPPADPMRLHGAEVGEYLRGIPQEIRICLEDHLVGADGRVAFRTTCRFPEGGRAVTAHLVALDGDGRIATHDCVEAVDQ